MATVKIGAAQHPPGAESHEADSTEPAGEPAGEVAPRAERRPNVTAQQKELAAILWANGRDDQFIQDELGISPSQLRRVKKSEQWERVAQSYRVRQAEISANHRNRMLEVVEEGYTALRDIIRDPKGNERARLEAIKYVNEQARIAETPEVAKVDVNLGFQQNNIALTNHIPDLLEDLTKALPSIVDLDVEKHVREGEDALPQAVLSQANEAERRHEAAEAVYVGGPEGTDDESL